MTRPVEGHLTGVGGVDLYWQGWEPDTEPTGVLLVSHGIGEHSGRYASVVDELVPDGWVVYGLDHRGHGRSGGPRAHVRQYSDLVDDLESFRRVAAARHPGLPVYLLGHSLGGQIALAYAVAHERELAGLVLSAPAMANSVVPQVVVPPLMLLARLLPTIRPVGIDESKLSQDPEVVADYRRDPLVHHGNPTLGLGSAIFRQMDELLERLPALRLPILVQHGTADALTDPAGTRAVERASGSPDTTVCWYEGFWHEIYHEPDRARPLADLRAWLAAHRSPADPPASA